MVKNKGFALIELIIVLAIIGILASVVIDMGQRTESIAQTDDIDLNTTEQIEINGVLNNCDELDCTPVDE